MCNGIRHANRLKTPAAITAAVYFRRRAFPFDFCGSQSQQTEHGQILRQATPSNDDDDDHTNTLAMVDVLTSLLNLSASQHHLRRVWRHPESCISVSARVLHTKSSVSRDSRAFKTKSQATPCNNDERRRTATNNGDERRRTATNDVERRRTNERRTTTTNDDERRRTTTNDDDERRTTTHNGQANGLCNYTFDSPQRCNYTISQSPADWERLGNIGMCV